jgi:hypothetical protein
MRPIERIKIYLDLLRSKSDIKIADIDIHLTNEMIDELENIWLENQDLRFTQLCVNTGIIPNIPGSWYYDEDRDFMENLGFSIREILLWGTRGINGNQPVTYIQLKNLKTEHIISILETQQLSNRIKSYFENELKLRESIKK